MYLFEVFKTKEYTYRGRIELAKSPYQENQPDDEGKTRKVWIFPVKLMGDGNEYQPPEELVHAAKGSHEKKAKRMSNQALMKRAINARKKSSRREGIVTSFDRDPYVMEFAKRSAKGVCQLCEQKAPFRNKQGDPYLETHHIVWLARGGEDSIENTVALCPNCHKKMHVLDVPSDVTKLSSVARTNVFLD